MYCDEAQAAELKEGYDEMVRLKCPTLQHVTYHGPEDAERVSGIRGAKAAYTFPAATLW